MHLGIIPVPMHVVRLWQGRGGERPLHEPALVVFHLAWNPVYHFHLFISICELWILEFHGPSSDSLIINNRHIICCQPGLHRRLQSSPQKTNSPHPCNNLLQLYIKSKHKSTTSTHLSASRISSQVPTPLRP